MAFDPKKHTIRVQGNREYLPVSARLLWFRSEHPDWGIVTQPVEINLEKQYAIFQASIFNEEGKLMATATKMENVRGFPDYLEKAETGSVGRALALCGYGTAFAPELEEGDRLADAPRGGGNRYGTGPGGAPPQRRENGFGGGGGNRPMPERPMPQRQEAPRPSAPPPPAPLEEDDVFADEPPAPRPSAASANRVVEARPAPPSSAAARPAATGGITRVREPERENPDPGGPEDLDDDPFAEDSLMAEPPAAAPRAAAGRRTAAASAEAEEEADAPPKPNPLGANKCSVDGCSNVLTPGQLTMSMNKFGRPICLLHQKDASVAAATPAGGAARRTPARSEQSESLL